MKNLINVDTTNNTNSNTTTDATSTRLGRLIGWTYKQTVKVADYTIDQAKVIDAEIDSAITLHAANRAAQDKAVREQAQQIREQAIRDAKDILAKAGLDINTLINN